MSTDEITAETIAAYDLKARKLRAEAMRAGFLDLRAAIAALFAQPVNAKA